MSANPPEPTPSSKWAEASGFNRLLGLGRPAAAPSDEAPRPEPLARLLYAAAEVIGREGGAAPQTEPSTERIDTPAAAADYAARFNLRISTATRRTDALTPLDFPVIVLSRDGLGWLLTGQAGDAFQAQGAAGPYEIKRAALASLQSGSVMLLSVAGADVGADPEDSTHENDEGVRDPLNAVFAHILGRQRKLLLQMLLAAAFSNLMLVALPIYTGLVYDRVIPHSAFDTLWAVSIGIIIALAADLVMRAVRIKLQDAISAQASSAIQGSIVRQLVGVRMSDAPRSPAAVTMRLREVDNLANLVPNFLAGVLIDMPFLLFVFALIWVNGGPVVLAPVFGVLCLGVVHEISGRFSLPEQMRASRLAQAQTNQMIESMEALETVKTSRAERRVIGRFERLFDEYAMASHVGKLWNGWASYANMSIGQLMIVLVMVIGVYEVSTGGMTLGGLSSCSLLVGRVISPIGQLIITLQRMHQSRGMMKALSEGAPRRPETTGDTSGALGVPRQAAIQIQNVGFSYGADGAPQLIDVSLQIRPGERVAIIGRSGSGKSTLLKLLVRLLEPTSGSIKIDDVDARQYAPSDIRAAIGLMSQTIGLFDDTLINNLTFGVGVVTTGEVERVCRLTGVADFAARHAKGYAMPIGAHGDHLSGGERQAVLLARVLLSNPKVLLLDEPTASMDTMLEAKLVRDMRGMIGDRTFIVATHRAPILELVDRIIWIDSGKVVADGPKADVIRRMSGAA